MNHYPILSQGPLSEEWQDYLSHIILRVEQQENYLKDKGNELVDSLINKFGLDIAS